MDTLLAEELQRFVHVFQTVDPHFPFRRSWQPFSGEDLEKLDEHFPVTEIDVQIAYSARASNQVGIDPFLESLFLYQFTFT